ncbi:carboxymuconolactone decarboxylase family protein [Mesorhizobium sp. SP-1A]|uniref:carboxymuconolactone decarboxylase family protein n=1 Tax=Mesorhizobium sp. SP-1A TaxID=3077840 RepID=UPI0028F712F9|nr:carboxymuconolactone decarboxylase family protein [Mesorhizobium sp. SP-1A]
MLIGANDLGAMSPEQRRVYDQIASGPRKDVPLPFLAMLDAPHLADSIQAVGSAIRFSGALADDLREVAILAAAAAFGSGYEWGYHERIAKSMGMRDDWLAACRTGKVSGLDDSNVAAIVETCWTAIKERRVPPERLAHLAQSLGRGAASEVVAISGYYPLLALFLSAGELDSAI